MIFDKFIDALNTAEIHEDGLIHMSPEFRDVLVEKLREAGTDTAVEAQRDYEAASDMRDYCEHCEPTYNPEDGSL